MRQEMIKYFVEEIKKNISLIGRKIKVMEVCGTHTVSIYKNGLHILFKDYIDFISGPGCPVCVTSQGYIDELINLSKDNVLYVFGDMLKVPGEKYSLSWAKANGADIRIMYSPVDVVDKVSDDKNYVIAAVGFETTAPAFALALERTIKSNKKNIKFAVQLKTIENPLKVLIENNNAVDAFILPGHVSAIVGVKGFRFMKEYCIPSVIAGFDGIQMLRAINTLSKNLLSKKFEVSNEYPEVVTEEGNVLAQNLIDKYFERCDAYFRGIGNISESGLKIRSQFSQYNYSLKEMQDINKRGCRCADVLIGKIKPFECGLFGKICSPQNPQGACMVSTEGSCAAYYKYGKWLNE